MDKQKVIVIDPGHGLNKNGMFARPLMRLGLKGVEKLSGGKPHPQDMDSRTYREDIGTLKIAKSLRLALECMGYKVILTREDERNVALYQKEKYIRKNGKISKWRSKWPSWKWTRWVTKTNKADLFISVHTNAGGGTGPVGFYANKKSKKLAQTLCNQISENFDLTTRGIKQKRFLILRSENKRYSVLFEVMFHDSPIDLKNLISNKKINKAGQSIAEGINEFLQSKK